MADRADRYQRPLRNAKVSSGARLTWKDKRVLVETRFAQPDAAKLSDRAIARELQVSQPFVSKLRNTGGWPRILRYQPVPVRNRANTDTPQGAAGPRRYQSPAYLTQPERGADQCDSPEPTGALDVLGTLDELGPGSFAREGARGFLGTDRPVWRRRGSGPVDDEDAGGGVGRCVCDGNPFTGEDPFR